jgi:hypothetical protein
MQPETIHGLFALATAVVTGLMARSQLNRKRLKEKLQRAERDIAFLLAVEKAHCDRNQKMVNASFKNRIRSEVYAQGLTWSGSFTPGRVRASASHEASAIGTTLTAHAISLLKRGADAIAAVSHTAMRRIRGEQAASESAT